MSTNRLVIVASIEGVKNVVKQIDSIGAAAVGAERGASLLRNTLGGLFVAMGASTIARYSDAFVNLENRLKVVTSSTEELTSVTNELYEISLESRSSFENTAKLYQRIALSGRQLGNTQEDNMKITELLNKAIILSGSSAIEASNAMIQLSQGMSKGVLNGDELRSVLEQLPNIADLIAQRMGVTRGELRDLGAQGKITGQIIQEAILGAQEEIEQKFGRLAPTIGQAFTNLESAAVKFIGEFNKATGIFTGFANVVLVLADNFQVLIGTVTSLGLALGAKYFADFLIWARAVPPLVAASGAQMGLAAAGASNLAVYLGGVKKAFLAATAAARAFAVSNPFTAIILGLTVALPLIYSFSDQLPLTADGSITLRDAFNSLGSVLTSSVVPAMSFLRDLMVALWSPFQQILEGVTMLINAITPYTILLDENGKTTLSLSTILYALVEGFFYMARVVSTVVVVPFRAFAEVLYALGLASEETIKTIRDQTAGIVNLIDAASAAQGRIAAFGQVQTEAAVATAAVAAPLQQAAAATNNLKNNTAGAALETQNFGKALEEKSRFMSGEYQTYVKVAGGVIYYRDALGNMIKAQNQSSIEAAKAEAYNREFGNTLDNITVQARYHAENYKNSTKATKDFSLATSESSKALKPAAANLNSMATASTATGSGLQKAAEGASGLKESLEKSMEPMQKQLELMNKLASAARALASAYDRAATAARRLKAAGGNPASVGGGGGGQRLNHNGGIVGAAGGMIRYHTGGIVGLKPNEVPIIAQKGEEVLSQTDPRHRANWMMQKSYANGGGSGGEGISPFSVRLVNGLVTRMTNTFGEVDQWLRSTGKTIEDLPKITARYTTGYWDRRGSIQVNAGYNPLDPFGLGAAQISAGQTLSKKLGRGGDLNMMQEEFLRMRELYNKSLQPDFLTMDKLKAMFHEMSHQKANVDYQTFAPWQQGYAGPRATPGFNPTLTAAGGEGAAPSIVVKMEIKAQDQQSFRRNAAEVENQIYGAVQRAQRRIRR